MVEDYNCELRRPGLHLCSAMADSSPPFPPLSRIPRSWNPSLLEQLIDLNEAYVDLCTSEGLVSVTGTVKVGASTSSLPRSTIASSIPSTTQRTSSILSASVSRATYDPNASFTGSVAGVPILVASGVSVSTAASGRQAAASTGASVSESATAASGAGRVVVGGLAAVVLGAVGLVL